MNRLQLVQRLCREADIDPEGPTSTESQTGEFAMLVDWIDDAYRDIQTLHETWNFMRSSLSLSLTSGTSEYAKPTDLKNWIKDDVRCYLSSTDDEQEIFFEEWEHFRRTYLFGTNRSVTGRPNTFSIKPDKSIVFWPVPDAAYTVVGEKYDAVDAMTDDDDEPVFDSEYHMAIVWYALVYYGASYAEADKYVHAEKEYRRIRNRMEFDQLPRMAWGKPLA